MSWDRLTSCPSSRIRRGELAVSVGIEFVRTVNNFEDLMVQGNALRLVGVY